MNWKVIFDRIEGALENFISVVADCADEAQEKAIEFLENEGFCPGNILAIRRND